MFSTEINGYDKDEVDRYISDLKAGYEKLLMEEKLKVLDSEKKVLDYKNKQKNIMSVLESFKKEEAEGNRNLEILRGEQLRMIYKNLLVFLNDLNTKYPGVLINKAYKNLVVDIESILEKLDARKDEMGSQFSENDPMRILLSRIQDKKTQEPKEIKIERAQFDRPSMIKPVCESELKNSENEGEYDNLVDKFLNTKLADEPTQKSLNKSNGFDLKEAVNPKDDLSEIMKAFDFFNDENNKADPKDYHFDD